MQTSESKIAADAADNAFGHIRPTSHDVVAPERNGQLSTCRKLGGQEPHAANSAVIVVLAPQDQEAGADTSCHADA